MASSILALDLGTSGLKAVVTDLAGRPTASAVEPVLYTTPEGAETLARELPAEALWSAVARVVARALAGAEGDGVAAVAVTSQRQGVAFLDGDGGPLYIGPNLDLRAVFEGAAMDEAHADEVYRTTGHLPSFFFTPAKLRWHQLHRPEVYDRTAVVLTLADWVAYRLTGELASEPALAGEAGLLDIATREWAAPLLSILGLRADLLPRLLAPGEPTGTVDRRAAEATGLPEGVPVVVAGPDTQCGLVAMGIVAPGEAGIVAGWSTTAQAVTTAPTLDPHHRTWAGLHTAPGRWVAEANAGDGGNAYRWLRDLCWGDVPGAFADMESAAAQAPPGAEGTVAMLGPAPLDLSQPGLRPGGLLFAVPVGFSGVDRARLARAALENVAYAVRGAWDLLQEVVPELLETLSVGGGMTSTALFSRILASVMGRPVRVARTPFVSAVGAAIVAAAALPSGPSMVEAARRARDEGAEVVEPDPADAAEYEEHYQRWVETQATLAKHLPLE